MYISDQTVEEIRAQADVVEVVRDYVDLKPSGRQWKGCCPFHQEKTPSFFVTPETGTYHCFGCGESGDVFSFIMKKESVSFPDAVRSLAERYHVPIAATDPREIQMREERQLLYQINADALRFYYRNLLTNHRAQEYLARRGLKGNSINDFFLGYADGSGKSLYQHLTEKGYRVEDLLRLGLIARSNRGSGYYDKFRDRIIFPIISPQEKVIGFGGRALGDKKPKYLNSPESPVFHKGDHLYNLNRAKKSPDRKHLVLVEGYMDVVSLALHGFDTAVASLGTSLTEKQAALIKRFSEQVYLCYDGDSAGIKAARRAIEVLESGGVAPKLVVLPEGKDPDDVAKTAGIAQFRAYLEEALDPLDFELKLLRAGHDLTTTGGRLSFLHQATDFLAGISHAAKRGIMTQAVAALVDIAAEKIESEVAEKLQKTATPPEASSSMLSPPSWEEEEWIPPYEEDFPETGMNSATDLSVERFRLEREMVRLLRWDPGWATEHAITMIQNESLKHVLETMLRLHAEGIAARGIDYSDQIWSEEEKELLYSFDALDQGIQPDRAMVQELEKRLENVSLREEKAEIEQALRGEADPGQRMTLLQKLQETEKSLRAGGGSHDRIR